MTRQDLVHPLEAVRAIAPGVADGFVTLRGEITKAGPLDFVTSEFVMIAAFATAGLELAVKLHARRVLEAGVEREKIEHAILLTFGATTTLVEVSRALRWVREVSE